MAPVQEHGEYRWNDNLLASKNTILWDHNTTLKWRTAANFSYRNKYAKEIKSIFLFGLQIKNIVSSK